MCGITGTFHPTENVFSLEHFANRASEKLQHRGPDHEGKLNTAHCLLRHRRLSIIDCSEAAHQPFVAQNGRYALVFNGEIFNYKQLREEFKSVVFKSNSDTEVLMQGLILHGKNFLHRLNGFFSIAFFDQEENTLLLARDRFGEKPLFWSKQKDTLYFASELESLLQYPIEKEIDKRALQYLISLSYIPAPLSIVNGVFQLQAGCILEYGKQGLQLENWYAPENATFDPKHFSGIQTIQAQLRERMEIATERRMVADVPLGSFLSGGIDSTIVSALARQQKSDLQTFSISFPDAPHRDESQYAQIAAKHIGSRHECIPVTEKELSEALENMLHYSSEPFADSSSLVVGLLSEKVKKNMTVALSGDGADELFGGYNKHRAHLLARRAGLKNTFLYWLGFALPKGKNGRSDKWARIARYTRGLQMPDQLRYFEWASWTNSDLAFSLLKDPFSYNERTELIAMISPFLRKGNLEEILRNDVFLVLGNDMLTKIDRMSMAHALEIRSPFLDHELVEYALRIPAHQKLDSKQGKKILRQTFQKELPEAILNREKQGFEIPLESWISGSLLPRFKQDWLAPEFIQKQGLFHPQNIAALLSNPVQNAHTLYTLMIFQSWYKRHFHHA
jgi:asparagine synthase (glutamine-hydrolysing)